MLILVVFHKQLPSRLERIPLRIIWQFLLCSQFSTPVSAWSLSSPFPWFSLPQLHGRKKPIMWGPLPLVLKLSVITADLEGGGGGLVEKLWFLKANSTTPHPFGHINQFSSGPAIPQQPKFDNLNCSDALVLSQEHRVLMKVSLTWSDAFCGISSNRRKTIK